MQLDYITPLILTYNEAANIERTLQHLLWATEIIVIDSLSTDATLDILNSYPQVKVHQRRFDTHATQWNFGIDQVQTEWCLSLDADYLVTPELISELERLQPPDTIDGYFVPFKYCVFGKPLKGTILPPRQVLFRQARSAYIDDGHTQLLQVKGQSADLTNYISHDDRKPLRHWLWSQDRYAALEVKKLNNTPNNQLSLADKIRTTKILAPFIVLFYCLIFKGGILDGWRGWYYAVQRTLAELLLSIHLIEHSLNPTQSSTKDTAG
jgi:glycosyltransferase involved in cell wall biosynthesis